MSVALANAVRTPTVDAAEMVPARTRLSTPAFDALLMDWRRSRNTMEEASALAAGREGLVEALVRAAGGASPAARENLREGFGLERMETAVSDSVERTIEAEKRLLAARPLTTLEAAEQLWAILQCVVLERDTGHAELSKLYFDLRDLGHRQRELLGMAPVDVRLVLEEPQPAQPVGDPFEGRDPTLVELGGAWADAFVATEEANRLYDAAGVAANAALDILTPEEQEASRTPIYAAFHLSELEQAFDQAAGRQNQLAARIEAKRPANATEAALKFSVMLGQYGDDSPASMNDPKQLRTFVADLNALADAERTAERAGG